MTIRTNARVAGLAFLVYIVTGLTAMVLAGAAKAGEGTAAKLASVVQHATGFRVSLVLVLVGCFCALALAVTLWSITRDVDPDLAMMILVCRTAEGIVGTISLDRAAGQLWLATASGAASLDLADRAALGAFLLKLPGSVAVSAIFFAVGSLIFTCLLVRGRLVPAWLAWLGVVASVIVVVGLPLDLVRVLPSLAGQIMWIPMLLFEVPLGVWLIAKGVSARGH